MKRIRVKTLLLVIVLFNLTSTVGLFEFVSANPTLRNYTMPANPTLRNYIMQEIPFIWYDASDGGTEVPLPFPRDDTFVELPFPSGFTFTFYDQTFDWVRIGVNGHISFSNAFSSSDWRNEDFPRGGSYYHYMIAPFWDDFYLGHPGGTVYYKYFPGANECFVIEWIEVTHYFYFYAGGYPGPNYPWKSGTFEVILYKNGNIGFSYEEISYIDWNNDVNSPWYRRGYSCGLNYGIDLDFFNKYTNINIGTQYLSLLFTNVIRATVDFDPDTLNRKSQGNWVTVYIELAGYNVEDIDISTILLNGEVPAEDYPTGISDGILMVKFDRAAAIAEIDEGEYVDITITGNLLDGTPFEGFTEIRALF